jgi:membrane-associated phospholipid phosphatase
MTIAKPNTTKGVRLAGWISSVFHPFILSLITLPLTIYLYTGLLGLAILWTAISTAALILPLATFIMIMVKIGRYSDFDVSTREQRTGPYLVAGGGLILLTTIIILGRAPLISRACIFAAILAAAAAAVINRFSKVSVHAMTAAGCAIVLLYLSLLAGLLMVTAAAAVSWSRIPLKRHTLPQVITGWIVATASVVAVFQLFL